MKLIELFENIGPHSQYPGSEYDLMVAGKKPAAILSGNHSDLNKFMGLVKQGKLKYFELKIPGKVVMRFFGQLNSNNAEKLFNMYRIIKSRPNNAIKPEEHRYIGYLLGYSQHDIDFFMNRIKQ